MKPIKLTMQNIGPFVGSTIINFDQLGEMFLICGDTGAGKTTILDAICFALYGEIPGRNNPAPRTFRSDFAKIGEESFVELDFLLRQKKYRIKRTTPAQYINRNGKISEKDSDVIFYEENNNGWQLVSSQKSEANSRIQSLINLKKEEFERIVLLPQGDFAEFLHLSSDKRRESLAKLFPVDDYKKITDYAEEYSKNISTRLKFIENQIAEMAKDFSTQNAQSQQEKLQDEENALKEEKTKATQKSFEISTQLEKCKETKEKFAELRRVKENLDQLQNRKAEFDQKEQNIFNARQALNCKSAFDTFTNWQAQCTSLQKEIDQNRENLQNAQNKFENLQANQTQINSKIEENEQISGEIGQLKLACSLQEELTKNRRVAEELSAANKSLETRVAEKESKLAPIDGEIKALKQNQQDIGLLTRLDHEAGDRLNKAKEDKRNFDEYAKAKQTFEEQTLGFDSAQKRCENLKNRTALLQNEIEQIKTAQNEQIHADMAFELAKNLADGAPCPVCGSLHHPVLARQLQKNFSLDEQLAIKNQSLEEENENLKQAEAAVAGIRARVDVAQKKLLELGEPVLNAVENLKIAASEKEQTKNNLDNETKRIGKISSLEKTKETLERDLTPLKAELEDKKAQLNEITAKRKEQYKNFKEALGSAAVQFEKDTNQSDFARNLLNQKQNLYESNANFIESLKNDLQNAQKNITALEAKQQTLHEQFQNAENGLNLAQKELNDVLAKHNFADIEQMQQSLLSGSEIEKLENALAEWKNEVNSFTLRFTSLSNELKDQTESDTTQLEEDLANAKKQIEEIDRQLQNIAIEISQLQANLARWEELENQRQEISKSSVLYKKLSDDLSGKNIKKLSFQSWILSIHLEEITQYANRRLEKVSNNRYKILLKPENETGREHYAGLNLEIFDAETGKKRPCNTLSGGETFLVSISLALALTDVVSQKGGIQLDSLFIDEGFGTLDKAMLEKTMSILDEIRGNRMIGLVSHRDELKDRIPARIEVTKTYNGSKISTCMT